MLSMNFVHEQRIPEWVTSSIMILGAVQLLTISDIHTAEGYSLLESVGIPKLFTVYLLLIVGILRIGALYINGRWVRTPAIRGIGAAISGTLFLSMAFSAYWPVLPLAVVDYRATWIAGKDAVRARKNVRGYHKGSS